MKRTSDHRGFTVIEVMVALVMTLIALDVLFGGIVTSLRTAHTTVSLGHRAYRGPNRISRR